MNKNRRRIVIVLIAVALLLFFPIPSHAGNDGGTVEFRAMTYSIVKWHRILPTADASGKADMYIKTSVYWFPHNFKDIDDLWELEMESD
jgi:hypothetical protein